MAEINSSLAESGKFERRASLTSMEDLLLIGALTETSRERQVQTDPDGLQLLANMIEATISNLDAGSAALGHLVAVVDPDEVSESLGDVGWLVCGLGRLKLQLQDRLEMVREDLEERASAIV